jgi:hypothetical protein
MTMKKLSDVLKNGTIPELQRRRKSLIAYRNKKNEEKYGKDDAMVAQGDIYDIDDRIEEIKCNTY